MTEPTWPLPEMSRGHRVARASDTLLAFAAGVLFALLQFSYFFLLEVYLTSRAVAFFVALFFWLAGFLVGLNLKSRFLFAPLLAAGVSSYYAFRLALHWMPFDDNALFIAGLCIVISGLAPGHFFTFARKRYPRTGPLFFHENNGFLLGTFFSLLCAVFAGKWLLAGAPLAGLLPVLAILLYQRAARRSETGAALSWEDDEGEPHEGTVFPFFAAGLHFGLLQATLFFTIQVYVTATFMGYFVIVLAWMTGLIAALKTSLPKSIETALGLSAAACYGLLFCADAFIPRPVLYPFYFALVALTALPAGTFFRELSAAVAARSLFLHENNGFVLGLLLAMFGFVKWGVNFLYIAPLLSVSGALLAFSVPHAAALVLLPAATILCLRMENLSAFVCLSMASAYGIWALLIRPRPVATRSGDSSEKRVSPYSTPLLLAIAGANLILLQFFITREFSTILAASEVTILIVSTAYFAGISVGYAVSRVLPEALLKASACLMFFLHMAIPLFVKVLAGYLIQAGFGAWALGGLLFFTAFATASLYSILLPKRIEETATLSLVSGYSWDLAGAIAGTAAMLCLTFWAPSFLWPLYFLLFIAVLAILFHGSVWRPAVLITAFCATAVFAFFQETLAHRTTEDFYRTRDYGNPQVLFQGNSFYHSVEVVDTYHDRARTRPRARTSFINGVQYFRYFYNEDKQLSRDSSLSEFTYFLAKLPARYLSEQLGRPLRILIMGGGSMQTLSRVAAYSEKTTLVEIDPLIVESAKAFWAELNQYQTLDRYEIVVDDVKHYLRTADEQFDLIVNDISAPYYLGTVLLHGQEFFELVKSKLRPGGLFAESTQGRPRNNDPDSQGMKILAGVASVFSHYRVVDCRTSPRGRRGYVYASEAFAFSTDELTAIMKDDGFYEGTSTYWEGSPHFRLLETAPYSLSNMETLLSGNIWRMRNRLGLRDERAEEPVEALQAALEQAMDPQGPMGSATLRGLRSAIRHPAGWAAMLAVGGAASLATFYARKRRVGATGHPDTP